MSEHTVSGNATGLPTEREILEAYREWLEIEAITLGRELYPELGNKAHRFVPANTLAGNFHHPFNASEPPPPSARAKLVLQTVGALPKGTATAEELAALEFEPWDRAEDGWRPPSNDGWNKIGEWVLPIVRLAWLTLFKTKAEIIQLIKDLDDDGLYVEHMENLARAQEAIKGFLQVIKSAQGRTVCAGAVIELEEGEADDDA